MKNATITALFTLCLFNAQVAWSQQPCSICRDLNQAMRNPTEVVTLDLRNSSLTEIPDTIRSFTNMEGIFLDNNFIRKMPQWLGQMKNLKRISLSGNVSIDVVDLFKHLATLPNIEMLSLNDCGIVDLPSAIGKMENLKILNLSGNLFSSIPDAMMFLTKLEYVDFSQNQIDSLGEIIWYWTELRGLNLADNKKMKCSDVANMVIDLKKLEFLQVSELSGDCGLLGALTCKKIVISDSPMKENYEFLNEMNCASIEFNNCTFYNADDLSKNMAKNKSFKKVTLRTCTLFDLKRDFYLNAAVSEADFVGCGIEDAKVFSKLSTLKKLNIRENKLTSESVVALKTLLPGTTIVSDYAAGTTGFSDVSKVADIPIIKSIFTVDPTLQSSFSTANTVVNIPAGSLTLTNGRPYTDKVVVTYKEFMDPLSIFVSGIPMTYDSGGAARTFSSAGMIDFRAQGINGEELMINPEMPVEIQLQNKVEGDGFSEYALNDSTQQWTEIRKASSRVSFTERKELVLKYGSRPSLKFQKISISTAYVDKKYVKWTGQDGFRVLFTFTPQPGRDMECIEYVPAKLFEKTYFVYAGNNKRDDKRLLDTIRRQLNTTRFSYNGKTYIRPVANIERLTLHTDRTTDTYMIRFYFRGKEIKVPVTLVETYENTAQVQKQNQKFYKEYQALYKKQSSEFDNRVREYDSLMNVYLNNPNDMRAIREVYQRTSSAASERFATRFSMNGMGVYNIDRFLKFTAPVELLVEEINDENGKKLDPGAIVVFDKKNNTITSYNKGEKLVFDNNGEISLVAMLSYNEMALVSAGRLNKVLKGESGAEMSFKVVNVKGMDIAKIKSFL